MYRIIILQICILLTACEKDRTDTPVSTIPKGEWTLEMNMPILIPPTEGGICFQYKDKTFLGLGKLVISQDSSVYTNRLYSYPGLQEIDSFPGAPRHGAVAFVIGDKAYVGLGEKDANWYTRSYYNDIRVYDLTQGKWLNKIIKFPGTARAYAIAFSMNGKGYIGTGRGETPSILNDFYEFDPQTEQWSSITFHGDKRERGITFEVAGEIYMGLGSGNTGILKDIWKFKPSERDWEKINTPKALLACSNPKAIVLNNYVYIIGERQERAYLQNAFSYWGFDPNQDVWEAVDTIPNTSPIGFAFPTSSDKARVIMRDNQATNYNFSIVKKQE